jgi:squalene cyclase
MQVLGVFDWIGNNPLPPEIWLLPYFLPTHPGALTTDLTTLFTIDNTGEY